MQLLDLIDLDPPPPAAGPPAAQQGGDPRVAARVLRAEARTKAADTLIVFERRGIDIDDRSRKRIESCTDLGTLNGWFRRAFKVAAASDLFEG